MRQSKYEFHETQEQAAARKRVRKFHFGHYRKLWAKTQQQSAPDPKPTIRTANGGLEPWAATVVPSPSSKQPRYRSPNGEGLSRADINRNYRDRQKQIPCKECGQPSWGGGFCQYHYKLKQHGPNPNAGAFVGQWLEKKPVQQQEAQP